MAKLASIAKTAQTPDRVIDSYMLRMKGVMRPITSGARKGEATPEQVISMFADFGRVMSPGLTARVMEMSATERGGFLVAAGDTLSAAHGTHFVNSPMYRAFPNHQDVMLDYELVSFLLEFGLQNTVRTDAAEHGANPVTGEQTNELGPDEDADAAYTVPLRRGRKVFQPINLGTDQSVIRAAQESLSSLSPFTPDEAEFVAACVEEGFITADDIARVRFREKLPALVGLVPEEVYDASAVSVTDALRLAAHFSGGDVSLTRPTKFKLNTSAGKRVLRLAERVIESGKGDPAEDIVAREEPWKRLIRHIGTYRALRVAPELSGLVAGVRAGQVRSFASQVQNSLASESAQLLARRPGAFVRSAVALSRRFNAENADRGALLEAARIAFMKAPAPALIQLHTMLDRTVNHADRFHVMKNGTMMKSTREAERHDDLLAVLEETLTERLSGLLPWSAAQNGDNRFLPIGGRAASVSSDGSLRGDSVVLDGEDKKVVRLFLHWKDSSDVDLTAVFLNDDGDNIGECGYYNLNNYGGRNRPWATHSGDIRDGRKGAAEYVDINIEQAKEAGVRTVLMTANVYSGKPFAEFPSHAGVMLRDGKTGKHFEVSTVETAMRLTSSTTMSTVAMFDLDTLRLTYVDMHARWSQQMNAITGMATIRDQINMLKNYGDYRASLGTVLRFAGTPGGPVLTDAEAVQKRGEILSILAQESARPREERELDADDGLSM